MISDTAENNMGRRQLGSKGLKQSTVDKKGLKYKYENAKKKIRQEN